MAVLKRWLNRSKMVGKRARDDRLAWSDSASLACQSNRPGPAWKDCDSRVFLRHCATLLAERGWRLGNADLTVVCERPRVAAHAPAMRANLAADLGVDVDAISVKATTSEKLGFTGRGEGLAAMAVALLVRS